MKKLILLIVLSCFCSVIIIHAQTESINRLKSDMRFLADDLLKGRNTPSKELDMAALYLASQLEASGIQALSGKDYLQSFVVELFSPAESEFCFSINGVELQKEDFLFMPIGLNPNQNNKTYDLVFSGQGIYDPENGIDHFKDIDLKGKAGMVLYGAPWELDPHTLHSCDRALGKSVQHSVRGSDLMVYVTEELGAPADKEISAEIPFAGFYSNVPVVTIPDFPQKTMDISQVLFITPTAFNKAMEAKTGSYAEIQNDLAQSKKIKPFYLENGISMKVKTDVEQETTNNVIATIKSDDPELGNEWIVLTAHYDHVGSIPVSEGNDGIFNGADDNASGTACILEIARKLQKDKDLRRSIMIVFCAGEENGLVGSGYFTANSPVPVEQMVLNINVDMVGRSSGSLNCINTGCNDLFNYTKKLAEGTGIKIAPDPYPTWRLAYYVDSYNFSRHDIPFIQYMTDFHADYHQPTDEISKINFEQLDKITDLIYRVTKSYAKGKEIPEFNRPDWFLTGQ